MNIGVSGASGNLGQAVLRELAVHAADHRIIAISRTPDKAAGAEGRHGDYDKPETLAVAYKGLDRLLLIPSSDVRPGVRGAQNVTAVKAAVAAGVKHIVFMSAIGTREQHEPAIGASYWNGEQQLIKTASSWTILRMSYYAESLAQEAQMSARHGVLTGLAENRVSFVSRDDVAAAAAGILLGDGHAGAIYDATGSRTFTGAERAALISEITGAPLSFAIVPRDGLRAGMLQAGLPDHVADVVISIQTEFASGAFDVVTGHVEKLSGRPPKALHDVLADLLRPAA